MKPLLLATAIALSPVPLAAQEGEIGDGIDLMEQGARMLMRGLLSELEPQLDEFEALAGDMGPMLQSMTEEIGPGLLDLLRQVDSFRHYEAPEILPNGDIILRRRPDAPVWVAPDNGEVDL
ncbi:MAG: hypothetical protein HLUCCA08_11585 [Rhodobacteraceae bacterium HLUCCA08]|nr:MAG: hypothetical protein HLUCCA08_11585 [Rhodobacteraceae bacterium HLUCCA08]